MSIKYINFLKSFFLHSCRELYLNILGVQIVNIHSTGTSTDRSQEQ